MPKTDPGSLTEMQTLELMAFLLRENGFPAAKDGRLATAASLNTIQFTQPE